MSADHLRAALLAEAGWHRACLHMIERFGQFTPGSGDFRTRLALIEAALASPIPARPAGTISQEAGERITTALLRCQECFDDGQGTDIGRPMLDALTTLGLLDKIAPGRWQVSSEGLTTLAAPSPTVAGNE